MSNNNPFDQLFNDPDFQRLLDSLPPRDTEREGADRSDAESTLYTVDEVLEMPPFEADIDEADAIIYGIAQRKLLSQLRRGDGTERYLYGILFNYAAHVKRRVMSMGDATREIWKRYSHLFLTNDKYKAFSMADADPDTYTIAVLLDTIIEDLS